MNRREYNKQETRRVIRSTFLDLYAKGGIENVTVYKICGNCGIARSTFYIYYDDKYDVLEEIESKLLEGMDQATHMLTRQEIQKIIAGKTVPQVRDALQFMRDHSTEYKALLGPHGDPNFVHKWKQDMAAGYMKHIRAYSSEKDLHFIDTACYVACSGAIGLFEAFLWDEGASPEDETYSLIFGTFLWNSLYKIV